MCVRVLLTVYPGDGDGGVRGAGRCACVSARPPPRPARTTPTTSAAAAPRDPRGACPRQTTCRCLRNETTFNTNYQ